MFQDDYIKASLLVASSGSEIYSAPGHAAIRLECPTHEIDYCYEFDNIVNLIHIIDYINGDMFALYMRFYTQDFIERYIQKKRGVKSITLNLTPQQKIDLWQYLDYQVDSIGKQTFDFFSNNCASTVIRAIQKSIEPEIIKYVEVSPYLTGTHREVFPYIFKNAPWAEFCWNILMGTDFDKNYEFETRLFPIALIDVWSKAILKDSYGNERPMCIGKVETIINPAIKDKPSIITPKLIFVILLIISLIVSCIEKFKGYNIASKLTDIIFMAIETLLGFVVSYMLIFSNQVATSWNWLIIVFSPLPVIIWLLWHKHPKFNKIYLLYTFVLLTYCICTPMIPQMQYASLQILLLAFSIRTVTQWIVNRNSSH